MSRGITQSPIRYWRTMPRRGQISALLLATCLLALALAALTTESRTAHAQSPTQTATPTPTPSPSPSPTPSGPPPDYSKVGSALDGYTHILRDDDLVVSLGGPSESIPKIDNHYLNSIQTGHDATKATTQGVAITDSTVVPAGNPTKCLGSTPCQYTWVAPAAAGATTLTHGRFFNTNSDAVLTIQDTRIDGTGKTVYKVVTLVGQIKTIGTTKLASYAYTAEQDVPWPTDATTVNFTAVADFNGDGYDDLLIAYSDYTGYSASNARVRIVTAVDVNDPTKGFDFDSSKGFNFGREQVLGYIESHRGVVVGDFNGDGQPDFATIRVDNGSNQLQLAIFQVDPQTFNVSWTGQQITIDTLSNADYNPMQIAAGHFNGNVNEQIVAAHYSTTSKSVQLSLIEFNPSSFTPFIKSTADTKYTKIPSAMRLKVDRINWSSNYDQIALLFSWWDPTGNSTYPSQIKLITVDPNTTTFPDVVNAPTLDMKDKNIGNGNARYTALDFAIGNFDNFLPNPSGTSSDDQVIRDPNLKIAVGVGILTNYLGPNSRSTFTADKVYVYNFGSDLTSPTFNYEAAVPYSVMTNTISDKYWTGNTLSSKAFYTLSLDAVDLQGRSQRLGNGYKIEVDKRSMQMILAQPPMHADYVSPLNTSGAPTVFNLSVDSSAFNSSFTSTDTSEKDRTHTYTHGWGYSGTQSLGGTLTFGKVTPEGALDEGWRIGETFTAQQDITHSTDNKYGTYSSFSDSVTQTTGLNDTIWYAEGITYIYVYEVIGRKICPGGQTTCDDSAKVPLTIMLTAPGAVINKYAEDASNDEWYQPVWENNNILSYPANTNQLFKYISNAQQLTTPTSFATDGSTAGGSTSWQNTTSQETDISYSKLFQESSETDIQWAGGTSVIGIGDNATGELKLDFGGSTSFAGLRTDNTVLTKSTGLSFVKPKFTNTNSYQYSFTPVIFGQGLPANYSDGTDPNTPGSGLPPASTPNVYGPMRSAYTVNPQASNAGVWWSNAYNSAPDVALNHPVRWEEYTGDGLSNNCLDGTTNCLYQYARVPASPWNDAFHYMRGFFIFKADAANTQDPNNQGPQQQIATAGDQLSLQARVYNYSFKAMSSTTKVHVRFYAMPWDASNLRPADWISETNPGGNSTLIGEDVLGPIPPFSAGPNDPPNYVTASVNFDTTKYANQNLVFWVMVWMDDSGLVNELAGKGLTSAPAAAKLGDTAIYTDMTNLEPTVTNNWENPKDPNGVQANTSFSNNIGFYKQWFSIKASSVSTAPRQANEQQPTGLEKLAGVGIDVRKAALTLDESTYVEATLLNSGDPVEGLTIYFYDGDPAAGGRLFDTERLSYIQGSKPYKVRARYEPKVCGTHQIFVTASRRGEEINLGRAMKNIEVECPTPVCAAQTCLKSAQYYALHPNSLPRGQVTVAGVSPTNQVSTSDAGRLRILLQGGNAAAQKFNQQFVALQLSLLAANDPSRQTEKSNLLCYRVNFQPVQLGTGFTLNPSMTIGELLAQARIAARRGNAIDQRTLANLMNLLNGDDPSGRCK